VIAGPPGSARCRATLERSDDGSPARQEIDAVLLYALNEESDGSDGETRVRD
jgi:hypothetical protein